MHVCISDASVVIISVTLHMCCYCLYFVTCHAMLVVVCLRALCSLCWWF